MLLKTLTALAALALLGACAEREIASNIEYKNPSGETYLLSTYTDGSVGLRFVSCMGVCDTQSSPLDRAHDEIIRITFDGPDAVELGDTGMYFDMSGHPLEVFTVDRAGQQYIWFARRGVYSGATLQAEGA